MKTLRIPILVVMALLITSSLAFAQGNPCNPCAMKGKTFHLDDPMGRNTVTFKSEAPLEDIIGSSNKVSGYLNFDPKNPTRGGHGKITVSATAFNTGIPLRNEHLRSEPWL
ncbi:MAG: YceI family protein, partial [bacterium]|nr:YceI family protein [bacterium]